MTVDPVVGEADAATVELAPEASARDGAFTVRSILLFTKVLVLAALVAKASGGMAAVLLVLVTLADSTEGLAGVDGSFGTFTGAEALVGFAAETWGASGVPAAVGAWEFSTVESAETVVNSLGSGFGDIGTDFSHAFAVVAVATLARAGEDMVPPPSDTAASSPDIVDVETL